jgi:hypothetical protein
MQALETASTREQQRAFVGEPTVLEPASCSPGWRGRWTACGRRLFLDAEPDLDRDLLRAGLVERALATVLESIALDDDSKPDERRHRPELHYRLIDDLS